MKLQNSIRLNKNFIKIIGLFRMLNTKLKHLQRTSDQTIFGLDYIRIRLYSTSLCCTIYQYRIVKKCDEKVMCIYKAIVWQKDFVFGWKVLKWTAQFLLYSTQSVFLYIWGTVQQNRPVLHVNRNFIIFKRTMICIIITV